RSSTRSAARPRRALTPAMQAWAVQTHRHPSVAGNGGSGHAWRAMQHGAKWLDHDLFLANQLVDDKADLFRAHRHNHHVSHAFGTLLPGRSLDQPRSEEHTSELQSRENLVCRLLLE